ncbi:MAG TPA: isoleucine--tRNA ligase, partial [Candidatus Saccharimonadales bacterium]
MKFKSGTRRRALEYEKDWVQRWKDDRTFEKSVEQRPKDNSYVFYDGPPFISGVPHHGTLLSSIVKDAIPRYQTMKGKRVERVWGWDAHGLPAERYTEKKLGIHSRQEVIDYGIEKYINATRANMEQTSSQWEDVVDRIGRWVDFKGAYRTMDKDYMESIWWAFKTLYEKGSIYEGEKVLMYCTLDGTPLSKAEVTMDAGSYQDVTDPSVYVKFRLEDGRHALAWTTTPWTLPANTALAVNKDVAYVEVKQGDEILIVAKDLVENVFTDEKHQPLDYKILRELKGHELVGLSYEPLIAIPEGMSYTSIGKKDTKAGDSTEQTAALVSDMYKVQSADYVETDAGTGIVHIAPTYGEEDYDLAKRNNFPGLHVIDTNGFYFEPMAKKLLALMPWRDVAAPLNVWESNKDVAKALKSAGIVWKIDYITHSYPHCHRCGTKLMYRAHPSWFMDIDGQRTKMLEKNEPINWFPTHVKHGRFEKNVQQAPDWNISRDRFWATAMPVWKTKSGKVKVVGGYAELKELSGVELDDYHRPWIDNVTFEIDGETYTRIDKVMDSWFEAGSMPFAQFHYPFKNKQKFEANFPGDFIVEYMGQVRAWFYYMHAMSVALFGENSFKNVIVTGNVAGNDGRKMSKSYGNFTDPNELMDKFSADSLRFLLLSSPLLNGEDFALQDKEVGDVARKLSMVWNMYDFFTLYAEADGWEYSGELIDPFMFTSPPQSPLDVWIISRLHQLVNDVEMNMEKYDLPSALAPILPFLDDASNWYIRRSRRRFWKSGDDGDKQSAYITLHYVLVRLAYVLAPFVPFLAEELYRNLTDDHESIHLKTWIEAGHVDQIVLNRMEYTRTVINDGLSQRAKAGIKVRQPLQTATVYDRDDLLDWEYIDIIIDELNLKTLTVQKEPIEINILDTAGKMSLLNSSNGVAIIHL